MDRLRRSRRASSWVALVLFLGAWLCACINSNPDQTAAETADAPARASGTLVIWHAYQVPGDEEKALTRVVELARSRMPGVTIDVQSIPFDAYASKLESAIPHGHGPDVFIDAHERIASYRTRGLIRQVDSAIADLPDPSSRWDATALQAVKADGHFFALPLSLKCLAMFVNTDLVPKSALDGSLESIAALSPTLPAGTWSIAYVPQDAYFHAPFAHAFGASFIDPDTGAYTFVGDNAARSVNFVAGLIRSGAVPDEADSALIQKLFGAGRAAIAISGPWFTASLEGPAHYEVLPLPSIRAANGGRMRPYLTVEAAFVSSHATDTAHAMQFVRLLADNEGARERAITGHQIVASSAAWADPTVSADKILRAFRDAAHDAIPTPTHPNMRASFEPATRALRSAFRGEISVTDALDEGARRFAIVARAPPPGSSPLPVLLALGVIVAWMTTRAVMRARDPDFRKALRRSVPAYAYVTHAAVAVVLLVVLPLVLGASTSLYAGREGRLTYVGFANYIDILTAQGGPLLASGSFYIVLLVTVLWTLANITLHVAIGMSLALVLSRATLRLRGMYRVLLIIPWAVPSYVTALAWKGMFHRQFGAVNAVLGAFGVPPVAWFARFSAAFAANVATNVWLGFPFMMVVTLGALTSISKDLYEAAEVDGATRWQQFWRITFPMLRPILGPSIAMGAVWTFNMFNVVFLVSGGEPDGRTDILVTEAYRWAFTRQAQYGYAAAYSVLIFGILVLGTRALDRFTGMKR